MATQDSATVDSTLRRRRDQPLDHRDQKDQPQQQHRLPDNDDHQNHQDQGVRNGRTYGGTGRLPRNAPFTPTYVNAYTVNSAIAVISIIVTGTFFYFKIIVGLLEAPQVGLDREFSSMYGGPADNGEPRTILTPICAQQQQDHHLKDDCALFGKVVVLADSISKYGFTHATQGWLSFLADEWAGKADVVLRGFPEYNTHWVKSIFPDLLQLESKSVAPVKLVIIALGTDDAALPHTRQHVALDAYRDNLKSLVNSVKYPESPNYSPDTQVVLVTPAPVHDTMWAASMEAISQLPDRSNNITREYAQACVQVAHELKVPVVDLWSDIQCQVDGTCELHESGRLEDYLMDGLHLKRMGNEVLYKGVMNAIAHHYPGLHPLCWQSVFPGYAGTSPDQSSIQKHCRY